MPITQINATQVTIICPFCQESRAVNISSLQAGSDADLNACAFPNCSCGAGEVVFRQWDTHPYPNSRSGKHKAAVNRLFAVLIDGGYVHADWSSTYDAETEFPPLVDSRDPATETITVPAPLTGQEG